MSRIVFIRKIRRPLIEKVILSGLMAMGLIATACAIVKAVLLSRLNYSADPLWDAIPFSILVYVF